MTRKNEKNEAECPREGKGLREEKRKNSGELTFMYTAVNSFVGLMTAFRPRKRAKNSHKRIACMTWRSHWAHCRSSATRPGTFEEEALIQVGFD
jgi:hypothetical protein